MAPSFPGSGLAKGLAVTLRTMTKRSHTAQYPDAQPHLPPRTRGVIGLFEENCTVCMLCARECPDWCIYIDSHKETVPAAAPGGRERSRNVLDRFAIDFALCMYCGICIEVCPFDALFWSPEFEYAETDIHELTHERDKLREWMWTVPAPPALDPAAEDPKEFTAARKTAEKLATAEQPPPATPTADPTEQPGTTSQSGAAAQPGAAEQPTPAPRPEPGTAARPGSTPEPGATEQPGTTSQPGAAGRPSATAQPSPAQPGAAEQAGGVAGPEAEPHTDPDAPARPKPEEGAP